MRYRLLGNTTLNVSEMGFGASPLGGVFGYSDPAAGVEAVHFAVDEGINFFDVSPYYGLTLAEERLGRALLGRREKVVLSTKCGRYGVAQFDFSAIRTKASLEESLRRLRTDFVDLFLVHDVEFGDREQIINETIPAMRILQQEGKARFIGITGYPLKSLMQIATRVPVDCLLSYCHYNLLIDKLDSTLMPFAEERDIGVINASPLHMGLLTEDGAPDWHPAPNALRAAVKAALALCHQKGANLSQLALRFCFNYGRVATTLVGMSSREEVRRNLRALQLPMDTELMQQVQRILSPVANTVWASGRPENHE